MARWNSMDGLAEKYYSISPYAYCVNNPIVFIDPDGLDINHYSVNLMGYINHERTIIDPANNYDLLFRSDAYPDGPRIQVNDQGILSQLSTDRDNYAGHYAVSGTKDDMFNVFHFLSNNTEVEWRIDAYYSGGKTKYFVGTDHQKRSVSFSHNKGIDGLNQYRLIMSNHTHPEGTFASPDDMYNMDTIYYNFLKAGLGKLGDKKDAEKWFKNNIDGEYSKFPIHYYYHIPSQTLYHYNPFPPGNNNIYIRQINDYTDLYRGLGF